MILKIIKFIVKHKRDIYVVVGGILMINDNDKGVYQMIDSDSNDNEVLEEFLSRKKRDIWLQ